MTHNEHTPGPIPLYAHRTDGGAEYLTDAFADCPDGHREGVFEAATIIIRLDGEPECIRAPSAAPDLLAVLGRLAERECEYGNGASCNMLPQGVRRSPCLPCQARVAIAKAGAQ